MSESPTKSFPKAQDCETFEEYALAASVWIREHPDAILLKCKEGEPILFFDDMPPAKAPGHIYSEAGSREYGISGYCEFHFDAITQSADDEIDQADPQGGEESPVTDESSHSSGANSETPGERLLRQIFSDDFFKDDDPNRPEPM